MLRFVRFGSPHLRRATSCPGNPSLARSPSTPKRCRRCSIASCARTCGFDMKSLLLGFSAWVLVMTVSHAQNGAGEPFRPGDRPAANPHATRSVVLGRNGMIATSQPLASAAGLKVLQDGGNAIDAAITAASVLAVVEPTMNGVGGDLFAIVYDAKTKKLHGLNSSGRAGHAATLDAFASRKLTRIPNAGVYSVSVPGVVDGWSTLLTAHGTIPLAKALQPAIGYAKNGYAVSEIIAKQWEGTEKKLAAD